MTVAEGMGLRKGIEWVRSHPLSTIVFRALAVIIMAGLALLILAPVAVTFAGTFVEEGLTPLWALFSEGDAAVVLRDTVGILFLATLTATIIGTAFAWLNERTDARMGWLADVLPVIPLLVPPLVGAIGWVLLASPGPGFLNVILRGLLNTFGFETLSQGPIDIYSWYGLTFVYVLYMVPLVYLTVGAALRNLDPSFEEAARVSGAGLVRTFLTVSLRTVAPAIASGALLAAIWGIALFSIPLLLGTGAGFKIMSVVIVRLMTAQFPPQTSAAVAYGLIMVLMLGTLWFLRVRLVKAGKHATMGGKAARRASLRLGRGRILARVMMAGYLIATVVLPFVAVAIVSLQPFWSASINVAQLSLASYRDVFFSDSTAVAGLRNSVLLAVVGATVTMAVAALSTFVSARMGRVVGTTLRSISKIPSAISFIVVAIALIVVFVGPPFALQGTLLLLFLGFIIINMPQASLSAESALEQVGGDLVEASELCGASEGRTFFRVVFPLMKPGLIAGWVFVFVLIAGDVTMSVMLASNRTPVIGFVMVDIFNNGTFPKLAAMGVLISAVASAVVLSVLVGTRRRTEKAPAPIGTAAG